MSPPGKPSRKPARAKAKAPRAATVARNKGTAQAARNVPKGRTAKPARKPSAAAKRAPARSRPAVTRPSSKRPAGAQREAPTRARPAAARAKPAAAPARRPSTSARRAVVSARQAAAPAPPAALPASPAPAPRRGFPPRPSSRPGIRLAGSSSSRLTIKPGVSQGPRPQLEMSTRLRPAGLRPLSEVELDEDEVLIDIFEAILDGSTVRVTAVLERTCVYVDGTGDRRLARKGDLIVEADKLPIRRRALI